MEVTVTKLEAPEDYDRIQPLYIEFQDSVPLNRMFGITTRRSVKPNYSPEDFIIVAEDGQKNIIGFAANKVHATIIREPDPSPEQLELEEFLEFITIQEQLDKLPQRWIELRVLMVTEGWRGRGVARRLVERSIQEAKAAGFKALTMCCVNEYTARLARSLGWKEHYRLAYSDYPRLSGRNVQLIPNPPHEHVYCYYTELTDK
ncbi:uncharacterized protein LOC128993831 [Macrosteles quadrilineatus]|uniref:uncharacterized protein LOC128993831 n=1 Tax=Macrosteles quadrilineatus TaxID=74068 RepID=UPI0023E2C9F7|nr:uncharacterized protein LOC128993831 [Macrosteles quadrilineatus]XP_054273854.1 uncharacterized protein LOC128993831 [Macrosteles quadrilineatus]